MKYSDIEIRQFAEIRAFERLITEVYPTGNVSIVSDTFDFWFVVSKIAPRLKDKILARTPNSLGLAKVVFRPDSGDPVNILTGYRVIDEAVLDRGHLDAYDNGFEVVRTSDGKLYILEEEFDSYDNTFDCFTCGREISEAEAKGAVECLWDTFGGTINEKGFKVLNERVGVIYGDSITLDRANRIMDRLAKKGFASCNWVAGIGSYTYNYSTRDTYGMAMKATYGIVNGEARELFKDPITDNGTKKSARGLLRVEYDGKDFKLYDRQTPEQEETGCLETVFEDGKLVRFQTWDEIRSILLG